MWHFRARCRALRMRRGQVRYLDVIAANVVQRTEERHQCTSDSHQSKGSASLYAAAIADRLSRATISRASATALLSQS